jgi:hypothetical protein
MPFYRVNGMMVHLNVGRRKAPAPCKASIEVKGWVQACCGISSFLCDHPVGDEGKTCDMPLCAEHAHAIGSDRHLCPKHKRERADRTPELW